MERYDITCTDNVDRRQTLVSLTVGNRVRAFRKLDSEGKRSISGKWETQSLKLTERQARDLIKRGYDVASQAASPPVVNMPDNDITV